MNPTTIRPAVRDDLPGIIALLADDVLGTSREVVSDPLHPDYITAWDALERDPNQLVAVIEDPEGIAGCLQITVIPNLSHRGMFRGQIEGVRIAARRRGDGLGSQLLEWAVRYCKAQGCKMVQLTSDKARDDAVRFYEAHGFIASYEGMKRRL